MQQARQICLCIAISCWGILLGGIVYTHLVFFPPYLSHLPESTQLVTGEYGLQDENFWMRVHPVTIVAVLAVLLLHLKARTRRPFIITAFVIYVLVLVATAVYFVPELQAFANSAAQPEVSAGEWLQRGQRWQQWSWLRGSCMLAGFILLLIALVKNNKGAAA